MPQMGMDKFLLQYFMCLRFADMSPEVRATFDTYVKANDFKGDFRGNMKTWADNCLERDPNNPKKYTLTPIQLDSIISGLNDEELEKLYKKFLDAFSNMHVNIDKIDIGDKETHGFVNSNFGPGRIFENATATLEAEKDIKQIQQLLNGPNGQSIEIAISQSNWVTDFDRQSLLKGITTKRYNSDPAFAQKLKRVAEAVAYLSSYTFDNKSQSLFEGKQYKFTVDNWFNTKPSPDKLNAFRADLPSLMRTLHASKKTRTAFAQIGNGTEITSKFDDADKIMGFDNRDSNDYVPPKMEDELTPMQRLSEWAGDTYDAVLGKYLKFKGDRMFMSPQAKLIVQAMHKAKIKPTDGTSALIDKANDIKSALQYKTGSSVKHFDWFVKTMTTIKSAMPKAFAGALHHGTQLRAVVTEIIKMAVPKNNIDEAKTAMEVLSVMKYGMATSKAMETFRKESKNMSIFSDKGLSWNKNEGIQFVTNAFDKSLRFAFLGIGYGLTIAGNAFRLNNSKFKGRPDRIAKAQATRNKQNAADKAAFIRDTTARNDRLNTAMTNKQNERDALSSQFGITDENYDEQRVALDRARATEQRQKDELDKANDATKNAHKLFRQNQQYDANIKQAEDEIQNINNTIRQLGKSARDNLNGKPSHERKHIVDATNAKIAELRQQKDELKQNIAEFKDLKQQNEESPDWNSTVAANFDQKQQEYGRILNDNNDQESKLEQYKNATEDIQELQKRINENNQKMAQWDNTHTDKYAELMAYWDFLESGRDSQMGRMYSWKPRSAKTSQKKFDAAKEQMLATFMARHGARYQTAA